MGRPSTVNDAEVFSVVGRRLSEDGAFTLQSVVEEAGISVGSLYHRYGSREGLLARTWLDAVEAFHVKFLTAIESDCDDAGVRAAVATPQFCRAEPERAVVLACCRQSEFTTETTPAPLLKEIARVNENGYGALRRYSKRTGISWRACRLGVVAFPVGAVRMYLPGRPVPRVIDEYVAEAFRSIVRIDKRLSKGG